MNAALSSIGHLPDPLGMSQIEDDYSVKLTIDGDPHFWWRVEKTDDARMLITDFSPGGQSGQVMASALALLVAARKQAAPLELVFHDLVPTQLEPAAHRIELNRIAQAIQSWSEDAAQLVGMTVGGMEFSADHGKSQMIVTMRREPGG